MKCLIILDDGHGCDTQGKISPSGYKENMFNKAVVEALRQKLIANDIDVFMTAGENYDVSLLTRVARADEARDNYNKKYPGSKAMLISIHYNALAGNYGPQNGIETYYNTIYDKPFAEIIHKNVINKLGRTDRGIKQAKFTILTAQALSCLVELGFMDNVEEEKLMKSNEYIRQCANALYDGIIEYTRPNDKPKQIVPIDYDFKNGLNVHLNQSNITKIDYIKGLDPTERIDDAYNRIGCDIIINANFFDMGSNSSTYGHPIGQLYDEYKLISNYALSKWGLALNDNQMPFIDKENSKKSRDFIGFYPLLIKDGKSAIDTNEAAFSKNYSCYKRGRTCVGLTSDEKLVIRCIPDASGFTKYTIPEMVNVMKNNGCIDAGNFDGGGSTQYITPWGKYISGRLVDGFLCIWLTRA